MYNFLEQKRIINIKGSFGRKINLHLVGILLEKEEILNNFLHMT